MSTGYRNNVTRLLETKKVPHSIHTYDYESGVHSATEVAQAIGLPPKRVFKTLVALTDDPRRKPLLVIVPGPDTLDLKVLAKAIDAKKTRMVPHDEAERLTGLQTGGISALALLNKGFDVYIDEQAREHQTIAVSAGERGVNVELSVDDLVGLTHARWVALR